MSRQKRRGQEMADKNSNWRRLASIASHVGEDSRIRLDGIIQRFQSDHLVSGKCKFSSADTAGLAKRNVFVSVLHLLKFLNFILRLQVSQHSVQSRTGLCTCTSWATGV